MRLDFFFRFLGIFLGRASGFFGWLVGFGGLFLIISGWGCSFWFGGFVGLFFFHWFFFGFWGQFVQFGFFMFWRYLEIHNSVRMETIKQRRNCWQKQKEIQCR